MKINTIISLYILCLGLVTLSLGKTALIQFIPESVDSTTAITINELLYESLIEFGLSDCEKVATQVPCHDKACALTIADSIHAQKVIFGSARTLGSKWIVRSFYYDVKNAKQLSTHTLDCKSIEDFQPVMRRLAEAIVKGKTIEQVASIDNITEKEADETRFKRREGFYSFGIQFGYLYPYGDDSYTHWEYDGYYNNNNEYRKLQFKQVLSTDFVNWFELPNNLSLQWDLHVGWGAEIGTHLFLLRQFGRRDYSPYAGGGLGINYCFNGDTDERVDENKRNSGFTLLGKAGIQLLRTYNFRVHLDGGYKYVLNDDRDQGPYVNVGVMWRKQPKKNSYRRGNHPVITILAGIGGLVVLLGVIGGISGL